MDEKNDRNISGSKIGFSSDRRCNETSDSDCDSTLSNSLDISVTVSAVENLNVCKVKDIMVKVEFAGQLLLQSEKLKVINPKVEVDLLGTIHTEEADMKFINKVLVNPIIFTVYDCSLPTMMPGSINLEKDVKKKTAKTATSRASVTAVTLPQNILGKCYLDIGILTEKKQIIQTLILEMEKNVLVHNSVTWNKLPRLRVSVCLEEADCLTQYMNEDDNIIGITIESVYNLPDQITEGASFDAIIMMPNYGDESIVTFPNGSATSLREPCSRKKWWSLCQDIQGFGGRTKEEVSDTSYDIISSLINDVDLEKEMAKKGLRIEWNCWKRCLLGRPSCSFISSKLLKYHVWPVEVVSASKSNGQKSAKSDKKSKPAPDASLGSDHFVGFLNLSSLLYPGVTKVRAAAPLFTYSKSDLSEKFGFDFTASNSQASMPSLSKIKAASEKSKTSAKEPEEKREDGPGLPVTNKDGLETFIIVEVELWKPLTRQKSPEYLEKDIKSYISLKGKPTKKVMNLTIARESFSKTIQDFVGVVSQEYSHFINHERSKCKTEAEYLSVSSFHKYLVCRESYNKIIKCLESKVLALICEKYGDLSQYNKNIPEIYASIVEEMHKITNEGHCTGKFSDTKDFKCENWHIFAEEAMEENDFERAKRFLLQKIEKHKSHPDYWLDYSVYCIKVEDYERALEAVREVLSLNIYNPTALLLYGSIMALLNNGTIGETSFQFLTSKYPNFVEGWKTFHLFYLIFENLEGAQVTLQTSIKLDREARKEQDVAVVKSATDENPEFECKQFESLTTYDEKNVFTEVTGRQQPLAWTTSFCPPDNINIRTTVLLLKLGLYQFASMALGEELLRKKEGTLCPYYQYYLAVSHYLQGQYQEAIHQLEITAKEFGKDCQLWSLMGHCYYRIEDHANAFSCYEYVMESYNRPDDIHLIYLRMGFYYLEKDKLHCAKQVFATGCKHSPSPRMWKGAGIALLRLNEYEEAETAFEEANYLDNEDPDTWAYLALVNGYLRRLDILTHCYLEAKKRKLKDKSLMDEIERCLCLNGLESEN